jgi:mannose-6-phosphate isomerase-like protein (cupin superfamily)
MKGVIAGRLAAGLVSRASNSGFQEMGEDHMFETIKHGDAIIAIIVRHDYSPEGIHFFTPEAFSQQLAYMHHPAGKVISPHVHNHLPREVYSTQEVLVIKRGKLQVELYDDRREYLESRVLAAGDVILLASGGHGFTVLEDLEMFEIKQGPYAGELDKTRFSPVDGRRIVMKTTEQP